MEIFGTTKTEADFILLMKSLRQEGWIQQLKSSMDSDFNADVTIHHSVGLRNIITEGKSY